MEIYHEITKYKLVSRIREWQKGRGNLHWHNNIEILKCLEGSFTALIDGVEFQVNEGDILTIGESVVHVFDFPNDYTKTILIQFPFSTLLNFRVIPKDIKPHITADELKNIDNLKAQIDSLFDVIEKEKDVIPEDSNPFMESISLSIYYKLMEHFPYQINNKIIKKDKQDFYKIVQYINEHFTDNITIKSISEHFFIDRGKISKMFSKYSGAPLSEYINSLRMNKALELIENGAKVTEAAYESGFQTVRTFNNIRKKMSEK